MCSLLFEFHLAFLSLAPGFSQVTRVSSNFETVLNGFGLAREDHLAEARC